MNSLQHAELLAGHSSFDLRSIPNSHCSWRMTSWDGRGAGGCRPNYEWTKAEKGRMKQRKNVEAERQSSLIRFLGRMTKLCGMQRRGEREVIKSSATKRGGKRDDRRVEQGWLKSPGWPRLLFIHFPSPNQLCFSSPVTVQPQRWRRRHLSGWLKCPSNVDLCITVSPCALIKTPSVDANLYCICDQWNKK